MACFLISSISSCGLPASCRLNQKRRLPIWLTIMLAWLAFLPGLASGHRLQIMSPDLPGASEQGGLGRDAEIVNQVLRLCGYEPEFILQPFGRHIRTFTEQSKFDAVMTVPLHFDLVGGSTAAYIWYQNGAYYDINRGNSIESAKDLSGLHIVTFKDGASLLDLNLMAPDVASVLEIADQTVHSRLLYLGRVDAILADGLIIAEVNRRMIESSAKTRANSLDMDLRFAPIFPPSPYKMVFRDPALAKKFDECFDGAREGNLISDINEKYIAPLQHELRHRYLGF